MLDYLGSFGGLLFILATVYGLDRALSNRRLGDGLLHASAGIAVAYAFVDVFPHLARKQVVFDGFHVNNTLTYLSHHLYVVALIGFCVYVGMRTAKSLDADSSGIGFSYKLFALLLCLYSMLLGYMLADQPVHRPAPALMFGLAMAAHMLGLTHELREHAPQLYDRVARYLLIVGATAGWIWGCIDDLSVRAYGLWFAFIAGAIVGSGTLSDLPRIRSVQALPAFFVGAAVYTAMLLAVEHLAA